MFAVQTESTSAASPLALIGACGCAVENDRVVVTISEIANHRDRGDLSGTLAIEVWAFERPYSGGGFTGAPVCGTSIGELGGQHVLTDCRYDLLFQAPPPGTWLLTLMLREWTADGYLTRDHVNFTSPYVVERNAPISPGNTDTATNGQLAGSQSAPVMPADSEATSPRAEEAVPGAAAVPNQLEPPPDPASAPHIPSAGEPVAIESVGAKLLRMVRHFIKR